MNEVLTILHPETCTSDVLSDLLCVEAEAWGTDGENIGASGEKLFQRISSFWQGVSLARTSDGSVVGSQYAFRFNWNGDPQTLTSWDDLTACGWTNKIHTEQGNTGFLVGVGTMPLFRGKIFDHNMRWNRAMRASELLIAVTLDNLFLLGVTAVVGNARIPAYHQKPDMQVDEYCHLRRENGTHFDPVLRFHERMGARVLKPVSYSMEDPASRNAGCWVIYEKPFEV